MTWGPSHRVDVHKKLCWWGSFPFPEALEIQARLVLPRESYPGPGAGAVRVRVTIRKYLVQREILMLSEVLCEEETDDLDLTACLYVGKNNGV